MELLLIENMNDLIKDSLYLHLDKVNNKYLIDSDNESKILHIIKYVIDKEIITKFELTEIEQLTKFLKYKKFELSLFISKKLHTRYIKSDKGDSNNINDINNMNDMNDILILEIIDYVNSLINTIEMMDINFDVYLSKKLLVYFVKSIALIIYTIIIEKNLFVIQYINSLFIFFEVMNDINDINIYKNIITGRILNTIKNVPSKINNKINKFNNN